MPAARRSVATGARPADRARDMRPPCRPEARRGRCGGGASGAHVAPAPRVGRASRKKPRPPGNPTRVAAWSSPRRARSDGLGYRLRRELARPEVLRLEAPRRRAARAGLRLAVRLATPLRGLGLAFARRVALAFFATGF